MTALRDLLEVYGVLDEAAAQSGNSSVAAALDGFLPKASANAGWYREVENFFFREKAKRTPNLGEACARLGERAEQADQQQGARGLTAPQKQRLFYGLSAAARIHQVAPTPMLASSDSELKAALVPALAAVGPKGKTYKERRDHVEASFDDYYQTVQSRLTGRADYDSFREVAASSEMVDPATLNVPLCKAALVTVDGLRCAVIDTELSSDTVSLNQLKAIVNPFNWNENYPDFFIRMAPFQDPFRRDRWRRVLETVGFRGLGGYEITTALKYYPTFGECEARLDYDLDDPTPGPGDGQVLVDRGYINMWVANEQRDPDQPMVGVRTRKVIHISGLSPFAQQRLVCLTGYGTASSEFLFGPAADPNDDQDPPPQPFEYYEHEQPVEDPETSDSGPSTHVVATAVNLWTDAVEGMTNDYFDMAEKWMAGGLRLSDVTDFSQKVTGRLVSSPLEFLERVNQPRYPRGRPGQTQQGDAP
ncbi:MAG: hypothetical protein QOD59_5925 [Mycobacterium sp.]|nr:hypothetical protein [Mycobacterium sp.]